MAVKAVRARHIGLIRMIRAVWLLSCPMSFRVAFTFRFDGKTPWKVVGDAASDIGGFWQLRESRAEDHYNRFVR